MQVPWTYTATQTFMKQINIKIKLHVIYCTNINTTICNALNVAAQRNYILQQNSLITKKGKSNKVKVTGNQKRQHVWRRMLTANEFNHKEQF